LTNLQSFACYTNQLSGPIPNLSAFTNLQEFTCGTNELTGPIPSLTGLTNLQTFRCNQNQLTGFIPSLSGLTNLQDFSCFSNQISGSIPSLSGLNNLEIFHCYTNQITGFDYNPVGSNLGNFLAQNNQLTSNSVNDILRVFVVANKNIGTRILNLGGVGNGAPFGQGITDKATLISRGWTVTTN
jgi:Leucine-rich repeat (LRR) protein